MGDTEKVLWPARVARWPDERLIDAWNALRAKCAEAGYEAIDDLPPVYYVNEQTLRFELATRFWQVSLWDDALLTED